MLCFREASRKSKRETSRMLHEWEHAEIDLDESLSEDLVESKENENHLKSERDLHEKANEIVYAIQEKLHRFYHLFDVTLHHE